MDNVQHKCGIMNQPLSQTFKRISFSNPLQSRTHGSLPPMYTQSQNLIHNSEHNFSFWGIAALWAEVAATFWCIPQSHLQGEWGGMSMAALWPAPSNDPCRHGTEPYLCSWPDCDVQQDTCVLTCFLLSEGKRGLMCSGVRSMLQV
jgi:hypothetical protein